MKKVTQHGSPKHAHCNNAPLKIGRCPVSHSESYQSSTCHALYMYSLPCDLLCMLKFDNNHDGKKCDISISYITIRYVY